MMRQQGLVGSNTLPKRCAVIHSSRRISPSVSPFGSPKRDLRVALIYMHVMMQPGLQFASTNLDMMLLCPSLPPPYKTYIPCWAIPADWKL